MDIIEMIFEAIGKMVKAILPKRKGENYTYFVDGKNLSKDVSAFLAQTEDELVVRIPLAAGLRPILVQPQTIIGVSGTFK